MERYLTHATSGTLLDLLAYSLTACSTYSLTYLLYSPEDHRLARDPLVVDVLHPGRVGPLEAGHVGVDLVTQLVSWRVS